MTTKHIPTREEAFARLKQHTKSDSLINTD